MKLISKFIFFIFLQDSPSNKLLYAKEIPEYKKKVAKYAKFGFHLTS